MEIKGTEIAHAIYEDLKTQVETLKTHGIIPQLVVLLVGENPSSIAYVNQKKIWAEYIGAAVSIEEYAVDISQTVLEERITQLNADPSVHAVLIQIPLPAQLDAQKLTEMVTPSKDIDGFHPASPFTPPLAAAVITTLTHIMKREGESMDIYEWLQKKKIVLIGKGKAGGKPVHELLTKKHIPHTVIDSTTNNPKASMQNADIIITAVGKRHVVTADALKKGVILIGVGMNLDANKKLYGDFTTEEIRDIASYYTPTPKGIGPINVACLLKNLVQAAS